MAVVVVVIRSGALIRTRDGRRLSNSLHAANSPQQQQQHIPQSQPTAGAASPQQPAPPSGQAAARAASQLAQLKDQLDEETMHRLTVDTLDELDWCLDQLEAIQAHRSVGDLATSKFRRMLNKELSHFSESKSGSQISGYIRSFLGECLFLASGFAPGELGAGAGQMRARDSAAGEW